MFPFFVFALLVIILWNSFLKFFLRKWKIFTFAKTCIYKKETADICTAVPF